MITAIVIPVDSDQPIRVQQLEPYDLDAYQQIIGGNLQIIGLDRPPAAMYLNEEGKFYQLRVNHRATALAWLHNPDFRGSDVIVGPTLVVGPADRHGNDTSVPEELVGLLTNAEQCHVQTRTEDEPWWSSDDQTFTDWVEAYRHALHLIETGYSVEHVRVVPELHIELRRAWFKIGRENPWIRDAYDPPFVVDGFVGCYSVEELEDRIGHGNWSLGTAFYYRDLCLINQINGGDEWLTIRHGMAFESITFGPSIEEGRFASLIRRLLTASKEQCQELTY